MLLRVRRWHLSTDTPLWQAGATAQFWPSDYDRVLLDETDSTMAEAARRAPTIGGPTWIMAYKQTAARGRRGRAWVNPDGNLAATLVLRPQSSVGDAALRSFAAANALRQTLAMTVDAERLSLKWPNDVLLDGRKVAGILLESAGQGARLDWLAIGIGVNLVAAPSADHVEPDALVPISVADAGKAPPSQNDVFFWLASHYADQEEMLCKFGFDPIRRLWLQHAAKLGMPIRARTAREEFHGTFTDVDKDGQLVLETAKGRVTIPAADVYF